MTQPQKSNGPRKGLAARYFTDSSIFERVKREIYFKTWQLACHSSQLANAGDYFSFSILDQDVFVIRGQDQALRAMYNVCQHRGHRLVSGSGNKRSIVCPYHAWTYALNGCLQRAPNSNKVDGFDLSSIHLTPIRVEAYLGFVFINLDNECPPMEEVYPGVKEAILKLCPDVENRMFAYEHSAEEGCNWLTAIENYNECYHCKKVHPQFAKGVIDPKSYQVLPFGSGKVLRHTSKATQSDQAWYDVSGTDYGSFFLWPSTALQFYPGGLLNTYHWRPLAVDDTRVYRGWYGVDGTVDSTLQTVIDLDRETTFAEDLELVKNVQRGLRSMGYQPGPLIIDPDDGIDNELSVAMLHQWLREAVDPQ